MTKQKIKVKSKSTRSRTLGQIARAKPRKLGIKVSKERGTRKRRIGSARNATPVIGGRAHRITSPARPSAQIAAQA